MRPDFQSGSYANRHKRFTEPAFRRFEPAIRAVLQNRPNPTILQPAPHSPETFTHRCRDAIKAYIESDWNSSISRDELLSTFSFLGAGGNFILTHDGTNVYVGPRERFTFVGAPVPSPQISTKLPSSVDATDQELLTAFLTLASRNLLSSPIPVSNITQEQLHEIQERYPTVELIPQGSLHLLL